MKPVARSAERVQHSAPTSSLIDCHAGSSVDFTVKPAYYTVKPACYAVKPAYYTVKPAYYTVKPAC
jgi:hypothetical protein